MDGVSLFAWVWFSAQFVRWLVWVGLVAITVTLLILIVTRWGQANPLRKCIVLSIIAHLLLAIYAATVQIVTGSGAGGGQGQGVTLALVDIPTGDETILPEEPPTQPGSWAPLLRGELSNIKDLLLHPPADVAAPTISEVPPPVRDIPPPQADPPPAPTIAQQPVPPEVVAAEGSTDTHRPQLLAPQSVPAVISATTIPVLRPLDPGFLPKPNSELAVKPLPKVVSRNGMLSPRPQTGEGGTAAERAEGTAKYRLPSAFQYRISKDRLQIALGNGGSLDTERAVAAGLAWLATHQDADGRWCPRELEGGQDVHFDGQKRTGAGCQADTGITGLAVLAFLAAGETHERGDFQAAVQKGLEFLIHSQQSNGSLAGSATEFELMYCHAMATFALSEALAMTGDERLREPVQKAIYYSLRSQNPATGGWRYKPGEDGDTSQLGWQVMALKSAEMAGFEMSPALRTGVGKYLRSVRQGPHGGWASYRPGHQPTRTMTAEAQVVEQFLDLSGEPAARQAAGDYLMNELPGEGGTNAYYYYYGTLATFQMQGRYWRRWNDALQRSLLPTQIANGPQTGSWEPDGVYGPYGGRAYSTALSTLCLEVYYRYLPLHLQAAAKGTNSR